MAAKTFYTQDIVDIDGQFFESVDAGIEYITENWLDFLGIGKYDFDRPELLTVERDEDTGMILVRYIKDAADEDAALSEADMCEEYFDVIYKQLTVKTT